MVKGEYLVCSHFLLLYCRVLYHVWLLSEIDKVVMSKAPGPDLAFLKWSSRSQECSADSPSRSLFRTLV